MKVKKKYFIKLEDLIKFKLHKNKQEKYDTTVNLETELKPLKMHKLHD